MRGAVVAIIALVALAGCGDDDKNELRAGDTRQTSFGPVEVLDDAGNLSLHFEDCTDEMSDAGGGRLVDFDPVIDAGLPAPSDGGAWHWTCG